MNPLETSPVENDNQQIARVKDGDDAYKYARDSFEIAQNSLNLHLNIINATLLLGALENIKTLDDRTRELLDKIKLPLRHREMDKQVIETQVVAVSLMMEEKDPSIYGTLEQTHDKVLIGLIDMDIDYQGRDRPKRPPTVLPVDFDTMHDKHASFLRRYLVKADTKHLHKAYADYFRLYLAPWLHQYDAVLTGEMKIEDAPNPEVAEKLLEMVKKWNVNHPNTSFLNP